MPTDERIRDLMGEIQEYVFHAEYSKAEDTLRTALTEQREEDARKAENVMGSPYDSNTSRRCAAVIRGSASAESEGKP